MRKTTALLALFAIFFSGCALLKKAPQHPLVGAWEYSVDTPQGVYTGVITFAEVDKMLSGVMTNDALEGETPLENIVFENDTLTYDFDGGQFGKMSVKVTVVEDNLDGEMIVHDFGASVPMKGSRKVEG